jgi:hypothetical protein
VRFYEKAPCYGPGGRDAFGEPLWVKVPVRRGGAEISMVAYSVPCSWHKASSALAWDDLAGLLSLTRHIVVIVFYLAVR